jgi:Uma2 family endonuclease
MSTFPTTPASLSFPEPAWDVALLFPPKGQWTESEYLKATRSTNKLAELTNGNIRVLDMPTTTHQLIVDFLVEMLKAFVRPRNLGLVLFAPLRVRITRGEFREPDVVFMLERHRERAADEYWDRADLVMEVVSKGAENRKRDLEEKRADYAAAGIPEYWIVDPEEKVVTILALEGKSYGVAGEFRPGQCAASRLLEGFIVDVSAMFRVAGI